MTLACQLSSDRLDRPRGRSTTLATPTNAAHNFAVQQQSLRTIWRKAEIAAAWAISRKLRVARPLQWHLQLQLAPVSDATQVLKRLTGNAEILVVTVVRRRAFAHSESWALAVVKIHP